jgi:transposase
VDLILDWPLNSPDLSPIELFCAILKEFVKRIKPKAIEELKNALVAVWHSFQSRTSTDRLELDLAHVGESMSNQFWFLTD